MWLPQKIDAVEVFGDNKNDHHILNAALALKASEKNRKVILVSKDINLRLKAKSLDLLAEDYETGKIKNVGNLNPGKFELESVTSDDIDLLFKKGVYDVFFFRVIHKMHCGEHTNWWSHVSPHT